MINRPKVSSAFDICSALVDGLRKGLIPWHKPWKTSETLNPSTGKSYSGMNILLLAWHGDGESLFLGRKQAKDNGLKWAQGGWDKAIDILRPDLVIKRGADGKPLLDVNGKPQAYCRGWLGCRVYPLSSFEGEKVAEWRKQYISANQENPSHETADALFAASGLELRNGGNRAYYMPAFPNAIYMPERERFSSQMEYYRTLFHETTHALSFLALGEKLEGNFGSEAYSREELTAEIGANLLASFTGLNIWEGFEDTQAYVNGWVSKLADKPLELITAASKAQRRFDWLIKRYRGETSVEQAA